MTIKTQERLQNTFENTEAMLQEIDRKKKITNIITSEQKTVTLPNKTKIQMQNNNFTA